MTQVTPEQTAGGFDLAYSYKVNEHGSSICNARFWAIVQEHGLHHWCEMGWPCDEAGLPEELRGQASEWSGGCQQGVGVAVLDEHGTVAVHCNLGNGIVSVVGAATTKHASGQAVAWARGLLPMAEREDPKRVPIIFWMADRDGARTLRRTLDVPRWEAVAANYAEATREALDALVRNFVPAQGGQLLLFHGLAGTGKTFALRAIASEWRAWCDVDYVIDPDRFLGEGKYLISVLLARRNEWEDDLKMPRFLRRMVGGLGGDHDPGERWRLIVMEDTGELLSVDAKDRVGQGLSRLLNTVDGLIGQGLRTLILVTTNEPIRELHPAVARAGRCAAAIEFLPLSPTEATSWLGTELDRPTTIADLYALRDGYRAPGQELPEEAGVPTERP
jgi:hypothetical protein